MSASANVQSVQALDEMKSALATVRSEAQSALDAAALEIRRTQDWIEERVQHWQNEVRRCEKVVQQASDALRHCQDSGTRDRNGHYHPPNCSRQEAALAEAQRRLDKAREELSRAQQAKQAIAQAVALYDREARRLAGQLDNDIVKGEAFLSRKIAEVQSYLAISAAGGASLTSSGSAAGGSSSDSSSATIAADVRLSEQFAAVRARFPAVTQTANEGWWVGPYDQLVSMRSALQAIDHNKYLDYLYDFPEDRDTPEAHHIVEQQFAESLGIDAHTMPSVLIPNSLHREYFTPALKELHTDLGIGSDPFSRADLAKAYRTAYGSTPELLDIALRILGGKL